MKKERISRKNRVGFAVKINFSPALAMTLNSLNLSFLTHKLRIRMTIITIPIVLGSCDHRENKQTDTNGSL
jgi:hypothetical protein